MAYIPRHVDDYLSELNSRREIPSSPRARQRACRPESICSCGRPWRKRCPPSAFNLTLGTLLQRITDRHLLNPRDVGKSNLATSDQRQSRQRGGLLPGNADGLRLPFVKEGDAWKIDVMALLPYAEVLMRVDRPSRRRL